jgi:cytochrome c5
LLSPRRWALGGALGITGLVCVLTACSSSTAPASAPAATTASGGQPAAAKPAAAKPAVGTKTVVDMNALFPPGPGRELVLSNCTNCHSIAPIVLSRFDEGGWRNHRAQHSQRVPGLSEAEKDQVWLYLVKSFPPDRQLPELPPEMLQGETGY